MIFYIVKIYTLFLFKLSGYVRLGQVMLGSRIPAARCGASKIGRAGTCQPPCHLFSNIFPSCTPFFPTTRRRRIIGSGHGHRGHCSLLPYNMDTTLDIRTFKKFCPSSVLGLFGPNSFKLVKSSIFRSAGVVPFACI